MRSDFGYSPKIAINSLWNMNVCTDFYGNPSDICPRISL